MDASRLLVVIADDFGIGPETSRGILDLAAHGVVTGSVLLVNSPYAGDAVSVWRRSGVPLDLGWHPNLTLDEPVADAAEVPSLVGRDGRLLPLRQLLKRLLLRRIRRDDIERELRAQLRRFRELVGHPPLLVNAHQHVALFAPIGKILLSILSELPRKPYVRRVSESWGCLRAIPGMRTRAHPADDPWPNSGAERSSVHASPGTTGSQARWTHMGQTIRHFFQIGSLELQVASWN